MIRRINLFGGAGCGKSCLASKLFADLKAKNYKIELVQEWIKPWAYDGRFPKSWDQFYVFAQQLYNEDVFLRHVDFIVTDSPLLLNYTYSKFYEFEGSEVILNACQAFEKRYPSLNFYLNRQFSFIQEGRYQDSQTSSKIDKLVLDIVNSNLDNVLPISPNIDYDNLISIIEKKLKF